MMATLCPGWTRQVFSTAPTPVCTAHPNRASSSKGMSSASTLTSEWREEEKRKKRFYRLSPEGEAMLTRLADEWRRISASLERIL